MAMVIAALAAAAPAAAAQQGLTMSVYNNSAWYGAPLRSSVVPGFDVSVPIERTGGSPTPFSVEITGTLTYPASAKPCFENDHGCFTFNCSFGAASYGFLWFDDHLVCQNGAYVLHPDSFDGSAGNPLRVLSKKEITVRLQAYVDPAGASLEAAGADPQRLAIEQNGLELRSVEAAEVDGGMCNGTWHTGDDFNGHDYKSIDKRTASAGDCCALCAADPACAAVTWNSPSSKFGDSNCNLKWAAPPKPWRTDMAGEMSMQLRPNLPGPGAPPPPPLPSSLDISVQWMSGWGSGGPITPPVFTPIDAAMLKPTLVPEEATRVALQQNLTNGWGTWANSVLDLVLMPEGARLTVGLCQISSGKCISSTRPSDTGTMRVAEHAYDKSYVRMFLTFQSANVSVEFSSGAGEQASELDLALTPLNCAGDADMQDGPTVNCSDFAVTLLPSFAWGRGGDWELSGNSLTATGAGLRTVTMQTTAEASTSLRAHPPSAVRGASQVTFPLGTGGGLSTKPKPSFAAIVSHMSAAHKAVHATHDKYGELSEVANAVQSAVMWCLLYVPSELGPFAPVSRSWAFLTPTRAPQRTDEWVYVIFDWE